MAKRKSKADDPQYYEPYVSFARTLRTWFIAFGIGGPAIFLTQPEAAAKLARSGADTCIIWSFLAGVAVQIFTAMIYKYAMSYLYLNECRDVPVEGVLCKVFDRIANSFWFEVVLDLTTVVLFANATVRTLAIFL